MTQSLSTFIKLNHSFFHQSTTTFVYFHLVFQTNEEWCTRGPDPRLSLNKRHNRVGKSLCPVGDHLVPPPVHPPSGRGARSPVRVLREKASVEGEIPLPGHPPRGVDQVPQRGLHDHGPGILLPGPPQVRGDLEPRRVQLDLGHDAAVVDHDAGGLLGVAAPVGGHGVLLAVHGPPDDDE